MIMTEVELNSRYKALLDKRAKKDLSEAESMLFIAMRFALEMVDGDLNDFFFNASGDQLKELMEALQTLGADEVYEILMDAVAETESVFETDIEVRQGLLVDIDQEVLDAWDALTEDYYDLEEDFWQLLGSMK